MFIPSTSAGYRMHHQVLH